MKKVLNKKTGIIAAVAVVIVIAALVVTTSMSQALTLDEAKAIAKEYVPSTAEYVTSAEEENQYEVMFRDDANKENYEVEVQKDTKKVKKVECQMDNDLGSSKVTLTEAEVEAIIKKAFTGVTSVTVTLDRDNGLYEYHAEFKAKDFYGDADVHPETGAILESSVKYGTAVTIPTDGKQSTTQGSTKAQGASGILTYEEVEAAVLKAAGGGFVKDIELDRKKDGTYYYEVELVKDNREYDYIVDAASGKVQLENDHDSVFHDNTQSSASAGNSTGSSSGKASNSGSTSKSSGSSSSGSSAQISESKARSIVLAKIPGAEIYQFKLDRDNGRYVYEGEARLNGVEYDFEIDASSGVIIDWSEERIEYDDDNDRDDDNDWDDDDDDDWDD